jgi:RNA polymerase sigma factor (sigma-70 family)
MTNDDMELVRQYADHRSEDVFAELVSRHANLVYSAALRRVGNRQLAEEITQAVFIILAQKATSLDDKTILSGWLYRATCYVAGHAFKQELRRQRREHKAYMESFSDQTGSEVWPQIMPLLEEAMLRLGPTDRDALVLRFFQGRSLKEVGAALGISEAATKMRLNRALEKLRGYFSKQGVASTTAAIAGAISANSIQAAPAVLAKTATTLALAKGTTASTSTLTLIKGALKVMAWTKTKTAIVVGVSVVLAAGTGLETLALIKGHLLQQQAAGKIVVPGRSWIDAGFAEPKSSLTTFLWAVSQNRGDAILNSFTPTGQQHWQQNFAERMQRERKSLAEILSQEAGRRFSLVLNKGFTITDQTAVANDQVILRLDVPGDGKARAFWFKKIGGEWKIDNFE